MSLELVHRVMAALVGISTSGLVLLVACDPEAIDTPARDSAPEAADFEGKGDDAIELEISLYILVDSQEERDPALSSGRTEAELLEILDGMNEIWSQANIRLRPRFVGVVEVAADSLARLAAGNLSGFLADLRESFGDLRTGTISGFYVRWLGGPNGVMPRLHRTFLVTDRPTVFDRRVSSHELGHILGLEHVLTDRGHLMFPGSNGMTLTGREVLVSRLAARAIAKNEGNRRKSSADGRRTLGW